jgi:hypothetical protein
LVSHIFLRFLRLLTILSHSKLIVVHVMAGLLEHLLVDLVRLHFYLLELGVLRGCWTRCDGNVVRGGDFDLLDVAPHSASRDQARPK